MSKLSKVIPMRKIKDADDNHAQITFAWSSDSESRSNASRFHNGLKSILPGTLCQYEKSRGIIGVPTKQKAEEIRALAMAFDPRIVTIDNCETLYRFNLAEGIDELMNEIPNAKVTHYQVAFDFENARVIGSEAHRQRARFYKKVRKEFPVSEDEAQYSERKSFRNYPTLAKTMKVAKLAIKFGATLVTIDACEKLYRYRKKQEYFKNEPF